jgi:hypothetical protein
VVKVGRIDQLNGGKILVYSGDGACFDVDAFAGTVALKERDATGFTTIFQGPSKTAAPLLRRERGRGRNSGVILTGPPDLPLAGPS